MNPILRSLLRQGVKTNFNSTPLPALVNSLQQSLTTTTNRRCFSESAEKNYDRNEIEKMIKNNKVVVFMKGNPESPRCGFSNAIVQIMRMHGVEYDSHDVLQSEELRQGIKDFSNWPTIPQVFINGEFVGGCDIMLQMHQSGDLIEELKKAGIRSVLLDNAPDSDKNNTSSKDK